MKLFEQIAKAMYGAYRLYIQESIGVNVPSWDSPVMYEKKAWTAAAKAAHKEIAEATTDMLETAREDARDAQRYRWLRDEWLGNEPEAINMERAKGQRGLDAAIDAAIAAAKGEQQ